MARSEEREALAADVEVVAAKRADGPGLLCRKRTVGTKLLWLETGARPARSGGGGPDQESSAVIDRATGDRGQARLHAGRDRWCGGGVCYRSDRGRKTGVASWA